MFRHIRWRLLAAYLVVILLALSFLGVHLTRDSETRYLTQTEGGLLAQARLIAVHVSEAVARGDAARTRAELQGTQYPGNPSVIVLDRTERVVALYTADPNSTAVRHAGRQGIPVALRGSESAGAGRDGGIPVVYAAVPIRNGQQVVGAVYITLPLKGLAEQLQHIRLVVALTILATLLWAAIVGLLLANRIAGPIQEMRAATARMAAGELGERVVVRTNDELGDLARSFNYMAAELERLDAMRREFVADASHELRTPVANLAVAVDALRGSPPTDSSSLPLLEGIEREVERLRVLVETLLDLSAIESGGVQLHMVMTNLLDVADRVVQSFGPRAAHQGITLERTHLGRPLVVLADPNRMAQVLSNLIDNALKFTPSGGRVTVTVADRRGKTSVIVDDTGPGIPTADLPSIFDRFFKADRSRSGRRGAGLGLAIAKRLVVAQGGAIAAENRPEGGARFVLTLPGS